MKAGRRSLQYSAGFFVLEGIVRGRDAHEQRVVPGVLAAVVHEVYRGPGHLETMRDTERDVSHPRPRLQNLRVSQAVSSAGGTPRRRYRGFITHATVMDTRGRGGVCEPHLYPLEAGLHSQLLHRPPGVVDVVGAVSLRRHGGEISPAGQEKR